MRKRLIENLKRFSSTDYTQRQWQYVSFFIVGVITAIVYFPSLFHVARADHIAYLADMAKTNDLWSLTIESYAFNRTREFIPGDYILFRPMLYFLMGFERWLYGYNFFWWQMTGLLLHLCIVWFLLKLLLHERRHIFAPLFTLVFSVQYISMEMVIWHHMSGYLLFCIFLLGAVYNLCQYDEGRSAFRLFLIFAALFLAAFTYELGNVAAMLMACYMLLSNLFTRSKYNWKIIAAVFAIPVLYAALSILDLFIRFGDFHAFGQVNYLPDYFDTIGHICYTSLIWFAFALVPGLITLRASERVEIGATNDFASSHVLIGTVVAAALLLSYISISRETLTREFIKKNAGIIMMVLLLMLAYSAMIVVVRANERGFSFVIRNNSYYAYISNLLAAILLYMTFNFPGFIKTGKLLQVAKAVFTISLVVIICTNAVKTYGINMKMIDYSKPRTSLIYDIEDLVAKHAGEEDFSFSVDEDCPGNDTMTWLGKRGDPPGKIYSLAEALFPQYYAPNNGKYQVTCIKKISEPPRLAEEGYRGFNIISYGGKLYGLAQSEGAFDIKKVENGEYEKCFVGGTVSEAKELIDEAYL